MINGEFKELVKTLKGIEEQLKISNRLMKGANDIGNANVNTNRLLYELYKRDSEWTHDLYCTEKEDDGK